MDCRNSRAKVRKDRERANGGTHSHAEWLALLAASDRCAECDRRWSEVPRRPDPRYKTVWTKGHKVPVLLGGSSDISNLQAECYQCNFKKNAGPLVSKLPKNPSA